MAATRSSRGDNVVPFLECIKLHTRYRARSNQHNIGIRFRQLWALFVYRVVRAMYVCKHDDKRGLCLFPAANRVRRKGLFALAESDTFLGGDSQANQRNRRAICPICSPLSIDVGIHDRLVANPICEHADRDSTEKKPRPKLLGTDNPRAAWYQ